MWHCCRGPCDLALVATVIDLTGSRGCIVHRPAGHQGNQPLPSHLPPPVMMEGAASLALVNAKREPSAASRCADRRKSFCGRM
jgi:hypothetical protein